MPPTEETPKAVFRKLPRKDLARFAAVETNSAASSAEAEPWGRLIDEDVEWLEKQPVRGTPSLRRLRSELENAGFAGILLTLPLDGEQLELRVRITAQVEADDRESLLRLLIKLLRVAGFRVGFCEVGIVDVDGAVVRVYSLTGPIDEVAEHGPPMIELE